MTDYINLIIQSINNGVSVMGTVYGYFGISIFVLFCAMVSFTYFHRYLFKGFM